VTAWDPAQDDRVERALHLRASFQGDVVQIALGGAVSADERWVTTFDQALRLGLQLELFIGPKEVDSFVRKWVEHGAERRELVIYDTMPGGTGYLRRMVEDLPRIATRVVEHLLNCACQSACYRCLKEFWNQRAHDQLDKRLVIATLRTLGAAAVRPPGTPPEDVRFESFLEARFYDLLREAGLPLPKTQQLVRSGDGRYIVRADFRYETPPLVILTDGRAFHASEPLQVVADLDQRNRLEIAGYRLVEVTYADVEAGGDALIGLVRRALGLAAEVDETVEVAPGEGAGLAPVERAFGERLQKADPRLHLGATIRDGKGGTWTGLAVDPNTRRLLLVVDPEAWVRDDRMWIEAIRLHCRLRLAGWRLLRVPSLWLEAPQGERFIRAVTALS
jgi:hypothetical protein